MRRSILAVVVLSSFGLAAVAWQTPVANVLSGGAARRSWSDSDKSSLNSAEDTEPLVSDCKDTRSSGRAIYAMGVVEGNQRETHMRFEIDGRLLSVNAREGEDVEKGDSLARLDPTIWIEELAKAEACLTRARSERERLVNGARDETRNMVAADLRSAQARAEQARKRLQRCDQLLDGKAISQQEYDDVAADFRAAQAGLESAKSRHDEIQAPARDDEVQIANANVSLEEARVRYAQRMLEKTELLAPIDGTILRALGEQGELVGPKAQEPIFTIADLSETRVRAFVEELDALQVVSGQRAFVLADGMPNTRFWGTVISCSPCMAPKRFLRNQPGERTDVKVREVVILLDDQDQLVVGLSVDVYVERMINDP